MTDALLSEIEQMRARTALLEMLVLNGSAARPPGAARAVAKLPDPAVAVIVPTFNRAWLIGDAIESVLAQSFQNWQLIVVDDGSTDDTAAAVAPYLKDGRVRYVRQDNGGCAAARNRGLAETEAPLVAYLDSDNTWYPDFLRQAVDVLATEADTDFLYGALVTDSHGHGRLSIMLEPFDRTRLLRGNYIDTNVIVHRRMLVERYGGWDPSHNRLADWELALRYTSEKPGRVLHALACNYRACDGLRITDCAPEGSEMVSIQEKYVPPAVLKQRPRVLYAVWHYPQLSETYIETELQCMTKWGVEVEVWREGVGPSPYPISVKVHDGSLGDAIVAFRPDVVHVHWVSFALNHVATLAASKLPVTVRLHGFDSTRENLISLLKHDWAGAVYAYPGQIARLGFNDARLKPVPVAFSSQLFQPTADKDPRLVVRTSAALPAKDLELFLEVARRLPGHRCVLAVVTCHHREDYVEQLKRTKAELNSPAELMFDVPREEIVKLVGRAGIYLHTMLPTGTANATPAGEPMSVAEAMATGCLALVRDVPDLAALVGDAGASYRDGDHLVELIRATETWSASDWHAARLKAIERAFSTHADVRVLRGMFADWVRLAGEQSDSEGIAERNRDELSARGAARGTSRSVDGLAAARVDLQGEAESLQRRLLDAARDWSATFAAGPSEVIELCRAHPEPALMVALLYRIVLGRQPDAGGMMHYLKEAIAGRTPKRIAQDLLQSVEYRSRGTGKDWWRDACRNVGEPEQAPRAFRSPAAYCASLAQRVIDASRARAGAGA